MKNYETKKLNFKESLNLTLLRMKFINDSFQETQVVFPCEPKSERQWQKVQTGRDEGKQSEGEKR